MGREIDERVVEMRFDNKQFEQGARQTMNTLDRLKKALHLDNAAKGLDQVQKAAENVKLDGLISSVEFLEKRFSALGIVGMRTIERLTDSMIGLVNKGVNFVSNSIVSGGMRRAMNIENAHFQLQALLKDEEKVQAVMDDAMKSVDGTAYAYDEAAKAASQFAASGLQAGDDMLQALRGIVGVSAMTNSEFESISAIFTTVAGNGRLMGDQLLQLSSRGLNAASTIADFVNRVNDGTANVSDDIKKVVKEFSNGTKMTEGDIRELVSEGEVNFKLFSAAMTEAFADSAERANETFTGAFSNMKSALARIGAEFVAPLVAQNSEVIGLFNSLRVRINEIKKGLTMDNAVGEFTALSSRFTSGILRMSKAASKWIDEVDLSKPLEIFYHWVGVVENVAQGIYIFLRPVAEAFEDIFLSFSVDDVNNISEAFEKLTSKFKLNHKQSKNLRDAFAGLFNVGKLLVDIFFKMVKAIIPVSKPMASLGDLLLSLAGDAGRALTAFTEWIRKSPQLKKAYQGVSDAIQDVMSWLSKFIGGLYDFFKAVKNLPVSQEIMEQIVKIFKELGEIADKVFDKLGIGIRAFQNNVKKIVPEDAEVILNGLLKILEKISDRIMSIDTSGVSSMLNSFTKKAKELLDVLKGSDGLNAFMLGIVNYSKEIGEALTFKDAFSAMDAFKEKMSSFIGWIKKNVGSLFEDFSLGSAVAGASGVGLVYSLIKIANAISSLSESVTKINIGSMLSAVTGALKAYQEDLKADALMKNAKAILVLAAALVVLSFTDTDKVLEASTALSAIAGVLLFGTAQLQKALGAARDLDSAIYKFAKGIGKAFNNLAKSLKWAAIGSAIKSFGKSILMISASIIALALMYRKDPGAVEEALKIVGIVAAAMVAIIIVMSAAGRRAQNGMKAFGAAAGGIAALAVSVLLVIGALDKLLKMELPEDYETKLKILAGIFGGLTLLAVILGIASNKFGSGKIKFGPMLSVTLSLFVVVQALDKIFSLELPKDYGTKLGILAGIFVAMGLLYLAMGSASKSAKGAIKAGGSILAMAIFVGVVVAALMILSNFPAQKLLKGAVSLGIVLIALGASLKGARKAKKDSFKSILAMAVMTGVIVAALGILAMIPMSKLLKSAVILGSVLLVLSTDFKAIAKIQSGKAAKAVLNMAIMVGVIGASLAVLALMPIDRLAASAVAFSGVLLVVANVLKKISGMTGLKKEKMLAFLEATMALIPITASLVILAQQPWETLLTGGIALSAVLLSFAETLKIISATRGLKLEKIALFLAATTSLIPITAALVVLAQQPWEGLLAGGAALSAVVLAFGFGFGIIAKTQPDLKSIAIFAAGVVAVGGIAVALYFLSEQPWEGLLAAGTAISEVLLAMTAAMNICAKVGMLGTAGIKGIGILDLFIANFAAVCVALGAIFENEDAKKLLNGGIDILNQLAHGIGSFVGNIVGGLLEGVTDSLPAIADNLSEFGEHLQPFLKSVGNIDEGTAAAAGYLADMIWTLTKTQIWEGLTSWFTGGTDMSAFGEELSKFGPYIAKFAETVKDVNGASVEGAAAAAKIMSEVAENLPRHDGIWQEFIGDNSLEQFGEELIKFGPSIAEFANIVKDVKPEAVEGAAAAATILSELEEKLPDHDGLWQKIKGDATLADFGKELMLFGPSIRSFATIVKDVKPEAVEGAAAAATIMSNLAEGLPDSGGWKATILGDNNIADFGQDLVQFGTDMRSFAHRVREIQPEAIVGVATITAIMSKLADEIPTTGGVISWFKGDNDISDFGKDLSTFGEYFSEFYGYIAGIQADTLSGAITQLDRLIEMSAKLGGTDSDGIANFSNALKSLAEEGITSFTSAFQNAGTEASNAVASFVGVMTTTLIAQKVGLMAAAVEVSLGMTTSLSSGINAGRPSTLYMVSNLAQQIISTLRKSLPANTFSSIGANSITALATGISSKRATTLAIIKNLCSAIIQEFRNNLAANTFNVIGANILTAFINGLNSKRSAVLTAIRNMCVAIIQEFRNNLNASVIQALGEAIVQSLANGISSKQSIATSAAAALAFAVTNTVRENCSYDVLYEIGSNASQGLADGLWGKVGEVEEAAERIAKAAEKASKHTLKERSPSKVMFEVGDYAGEGFVLGLLKWLTGTETTAEEMATSVIKPIQLAIATILSLVDQDWELHPTITPVVDTSNITRSAYAINSMFNEGIRLNRAYDQALNTASTFSSYQGGYLMQESNRGTEELQPVPMQFIQNNYSPKALSRSDIYRQTKNLFSMAKGAAQRK